MVVPATAVRVRAPVLGRRARGPREGVEASTEAYGWGAWSESMVVVFGVVLIISKLRCATATFCLPGPNSYSTSCTGAYESRYYGLSRERTSR